MNVTKAEEVLMRGEGRGEHDGKIEERENSSSDTYERALN